MNKEHQPNFRLDNGDVLWVGKRLCVPADEEIKTEILKEAHKSPYSMHPGRTKMYRDLKQSFWWRNMKRDIAAFVSRCLSKDRTSKTSRNFTNASYSSVEMGTHNNGFRFWITSF